MQLRWIDAPTGVRAAPLERCRPQRSAEPLARRVVAQLGPTAPFGVSDLAAIGVPSNATEVVASHGSTQTGGWVWQVPDPVISTDRLWAAHFPAPMAPGALLVTTSVAAVAGHVSRRRGRGLVVAVNTEDIDTSIALADARLELSCWFRTLTLDRATTVGASEPDGPIEDLPLPHRHGARWALGSSAGADVLREASGAAIVASLSSTTMIADPIVATTRRDQRGVLDAVLAEADRRGATRVVVAAGPGEPQLDDLVASRGFDRTVDWWWLEG